MEATQSGQIGYQLTPVAQKGYERVTRGLKTAGQLAEHVKTALTKYVLQSDNARLTTEFLQAAREMALREATWAYTGGSTRLDDLRNSSDPKDQSLLGDIASLVPTEQEVMETMMSSTNGLQYGDKLTRALGERLADTLTAPYNQRVLTDHVQGLNAVPVTEVESYARAFSWKTHTEDRREAKRITNYAQLGDTRRVQEVMQANIGAAAQAYIRTEVAPEIDTFVSDVDHSVNTLEQLLSKQKPDQN